MGPMLNHLHFPCFRVHKSQKVQPYIRFRLYYRPNQGEPWPSAALHTFQPMLTCPHCFSVYLRYLYLPGEVLSSPFLPCFEYQPQLAYCYPTRFSSYPKLFQLSYIFKPHLLFFHYTTTLIALIVQQLFISPVLMLTTDSLLVRSMFSNHLVWCGSSYTPHLQQELLPDSSSEFHRGLPWHHIYHKQLTFLWFSDPLFFCCHDLDKRFTRRIGNQFCCLMKFLYLIYLNCFQSKA